MTQLAKSQAAEASDMLVVNLVRDSAGGLIANSVELLSQAFQTRIILKEKPAVETAFTEAFALQLHSVINRALASRMLILSDYRLDLGDVLFEGCRVLISNSRKAGETVMVRFKAFKGHFNAIFREGIGLPHLQREAPSVSAEIWESVFLPLLNFRSYLAVAFSQQALNDDERGFLRVMKRRIDRLEESADLLERLVKCESIRTPQAGTLPSDDAEPQIDFLPRLEGDFR